MTEKRIANVRVIYPQGHVAQVSVPYWPPQNGVGSPISSLLRTCQRRYGHGWLRRMGGRFVFRVERRVDGLAASR